MQPSPRPVIDTPTFCAQASVRGLDGGYIDAVRAMLARGQHGKRILKFDFVPWISQPAGIYQWSVNALGMVPHRIRYFDFGPRRSAFLISLDDYDGEWNLPKFQKELVELLPFAEMIHRQMATVHA